MISNEIIKYSLKNLEKRKSRSLLTIISILVGIATIFIFISFGLGLYSYINSFVTGGNADKLIIQPKGSSLLTSQGFTEKDLTAVKRAAGVRDATGYYTKAAEIQSNKQTKYAFILGYDPTKASLLDEASNLKIDVGRNLQSGNNYDVVLGHDYELDNKIFTKGLSVNDVVYVQGDKLKIIGFYQSVGNPGDDSNIYVTDTLFKELYPNVTKYSVIIAQADAGNITKVVNSVQKSLLNSRNLKTGQQDFTVASFQNLLDSYKSSLNIVIGFIILIALISVLVSAINTSNTMITSVLERTKEIGVLKSIGARNSEILSLFLFESSFLGLVAGILGVALGFGLTELGGSMLSSVGFGFLQPAYSTWSFLGCVAFATLTGAVSGTLPAIKASRTDPVDALRYE